MGDRAGPPPTPTPGQVDELKLVQAIIMEDMSELSGELHIQGSTVLAGAMGALAEMFGLAFTEGPLLLEAWDELCQIGRETVIVAFNSKAGVTGKEKMQ